jgi:site-specific recombinase XerD
LSKGHDIVTVQRLVGHASVTTTSRYDRRPEAVRRAAAESIDIPYEEGDDAD